MGRVHTGFLFPSRRFFGRFLRDLSFGCVAVAPDSPFGGRSFGRLQHTDYRSLVEIHTATPNAGYCSGPVSPNHFCAVCCNDDSTSYSDCVPRCACRLCSALDCLGHPRMENKAAPQWAPAPTPSRMRVAQRESSRNSWRARVNTGTHAVFTARSRRSVHLGSAARFGRTMHCGHSF